MFPTEISMTQTLKARTPQRWPSGLSSHAKTAASAAIHVIMKPRHGSSVSGEISVAKAGE